MNRTTVLIVDDHQLLRQALSFILRTDPRYEVIGECSNADEAIELATLLRPGIIILDIGLPGISGIEAVPKLLKASPPSKILGVSMHTEPSYASKMIRDGAMGYVCKNSTAKEMFTAIEEICNGRKYLCQEIKEAITQQILNNEESSTIGSLSRRELEVIRFIKEGLSSKEIAHKLFLSVKTIEVHRYHILKKLKLKNSAALVNFINKNKFGNF